MLTNIKTIANRKRNILPFMRVLQKQMTKYMLKAIKFEKIQKFKISNIKTKKSLKMNFDFFCLNITLYIYICQYCTGRFFESRQEIKFHYDQKTVFA